MKRVHYEGVPFGGHNPPHIKNPKWGTPNLQKNRIPYIYLFHPILSKNSVNSMAQLFFKS